MSLTLSQGHPTSRNWRPILVVHVHQIFNSQLFFSLNYKPFIIFFEEIRFLAWPWPLTPEKNVCPSLFFLGFFSWSIYMSKDSEKPWYQTFAICYGFTPIWQSIDWTMSKLLHGPNTLWSVGSALIRSSTSLGQEHVWGKRPPEEEFLWHCSLCMLAKPFWIFGPSNGHTCRPQGESLKGD